MSDDPPPLPGPPPPPPAGSEASPPLPPPPPAPDLTVAQPPPFMPVPRAESQFASDRKSSNIVMYVSIGCGLLALIAIVAVALGIGWGVRTVGGVVSKVQANPEKFAAEMIVKADPNLELIASDDTKGEITFRNKTSGETLSVSYAEVAKGNFTVTTTGPDGTTTTRLGSLQGAPAWFPLMDGLVTAGTEIRRTADSKETIHLTATSEAPTDEIVAFYTDELDKLGFTIARESQSAGALSNERIEAADDVGGRRVTLNITRPHPDAPAGLVVTIESPAAP